MRVWGFLLTMALAANAASAAELTGTLQKIKERKKK